MRYVVKINDEALFENYRKIASSLNVSNRAKKKKSEKGTKPDAFVWLFLDKVCLVKLPHRSYIWLYNMGGCAKVLCGVAKVWHQVCTTIHYYIYVHIYLYDIPVYFIQFSFRYAACILYIRVYGGLGYEMVLSL